MARVLRRRCSHFGNLFALNTKIGLVDKIGDLDDAVSEAAKLAGIDMNKTDVVILRLENENVHKIKYEVLRCANIVLLQGSNYCIYFHLHPRIPCMLSFPLLH